MRKVLGLQVLKDTKYLSVRTRCDGDCHAFHCIDDDYDAYDALLPRICRVYESRKLGSALRSKSKR